MKNSSPYITITFSRGWLVTFAGAGMGLVLGILYTWSVIKSGIPLSWGWSNADKALPYSIMAITFSIIMVPAGRFQDYYGPRMVIAIGGFLAGLGCIVSGFGGASRIGYVIGFGVLTGAGVGFAYSALTPAAIRWFSPRRTGLIAGIVVAGFGLAPVLLAPLSAGLLTFFETSTASGVVEKGVSSTMIALGIFLWLVVGSLLWFITNPPIDFVSPAGSPVIFHTSSNEFDWKRMVSTLQFWLLFVMYFSGASAGLVFISVAADLGARTLGEWAFLSVVVLSLGNTCGRILAGVISDTIGRQWTLFAEFLCQGAAIAVLYWLSNHGGGGCTAILILVFMIGMNYGANLTLFPAACKDYFGMRNFGLNYGWLFTAFGTAGLVMPWLNGYIRDMTGKPDLSYILIMVMMVTSALLALVSRRLGPPSMGS